MELSAQTLKLLCSETFQFRDIFVCLCFCFLLASMAKTMENSSSYTSIGKLSPRSKLVVSDSLLIPPLRLHTDISNVTHLK